MFSTQPTPNELKSFSLNNSRMPSFKRRPSVFVMKLPATPRSLTCDVLSRSMPSCCMCCRTLSLSGSTSTTHGSNACSMSRSNCASSPDIAIHRWSATWRMLRRRAGSTISMWLIRSWHSAAHGRGVRAWRGGDAEWGVWRGEGVQGWGCGVVGVWRSEGVEGRGCGGVGAWKGRAVEGWECGGVGVWRGGMVGWVCEGVRVRRGEGVEGGRGYGGWGVDGGGGAGQGGGCGGVGVWHRPQCRGVGYDTGCRYTGPTVWYRAGVYRADGMTYIYHTALMRQLCQILCHLPQ